jgi:hypothetical protein
MRRSKRRYIKLLALLCLFVAALIAADNPFLGTWTLNVNKCKYTVGQPQKELTVTFQQDGEKIKRTAVGFETNGTPIKEQDSRAWDGKYHAFDPPVIQVAVTRVGDRTLDVKVKQNGKIIDRSTMTVSLDGKTMTATRNGKDEQGRPFVGTDVFDKQ